VSGRLDGKVALISGIASGQGRAAAILFAREGASVVGCDLNTAGGKRTVDEIAAAGGAAEFVEANAMDEDGVRAWVDAAASRFGGVDVLYNNAALTNFVELVDMDLGSWQWAIRAELDVVFLGCKHAIPEMRRRGGGSVINTASISGLVSTELPGLRGGMAHAAGKAGVIGFTRSVAHEYARDHVRANVICPGPIETPSMGPLLENEAYRDAILSKVLVGRMGKPEDVAYLALYLASDESSFVTAAVFTIDGGWTAH
jgi:NAD(P)-dependent dehydrogenase (short-subunit alcohol dehydrogenase family)